MKTKAFLTIDTEFSIGGAFRLTSTLEPIGAQNVLAEIDGRSEGLAFLLDTFARSRVQATFFTETLHTAYFGDAPMGELVQRIAAAGHDVQLHLHPVWTYFDRPGWRERLATEAPNDDLHGQTVERLAGLMQRGVDTFARWGLPAPVALRTGNLMVDRNVYRAMRSVGLHLASNVACAVFEPAEAGLRFNAGVREVEGVTELPVLTYADLRWAGRTHRKALTITGSSTAETCCLLDRAQAAGVEAVVLLTHCHEFVKGDMRGALRPDRVNQGRLAAVCRHLAAHPDRFEARTFGSLVNVPLQPGRAEHDPLLGVPPPLALARIVHNKLNELNLV